MIQYSHIAFDAYDDSDKNGELKWKNWFLQTYACKVLQ